MWWEDKNSIKRIMTAEVNGRRGWWWQKKRWGDMIQQDINSLRLKKEQTGDQKKWGGRIQVADRHWEGLIQAGRRYISESSSRPIMRSGAFGRQPFGRWQRKRWQLSFQLQGIILINPNTRWGVIIFIRRTQIKQEFVIFMTPASISVIRHRFHQQSSYLIRILCMHPAPSSVIIIMIYFNNPTSTFNIMILINPVPKRPVPRSHVPPLWTYDMSVID